MSLIDTARDELAGAYDMGITADAMAAVQAVVTATSEHTELERHCPGLAERAVAAQAAVAGRGEVCDRAGEALRNLCVMRKRLEARCTEEGGGNKQAGVREQACSCGDGRSIRNIFRSWEKLRIVYNLVMLVVAILAIYSAYQDTTCDAPQIHPVALAMGIALAAMAANLLYFAGPVLEAYVAWLGGRTRLLRWLLFIGGVMISIVLELAVLGKLLAPF